jgi:hypothetical protein
MEQRSRKENPTLQEDSRRNISVSVAEPDAMFAIVNNPSLADVVEEADARGSRMMHPLTEPLSGEI